MTGSWFSRKGPTLPASASEENDSLQAQAQLPFQIMLSPSRPADLGSINKNPGKMQIQKALKLTEDEFEKIRDGMAKALEDNEDLRNMDLDSKTGADQLRISFCTQISNSLNAYLSTDVEILDKLKEKEAITPWLLYKLILLKRKDVKQGIVKKQKKTEKEEQDRIEIAAKEKQRRDLEAFKASFRPGLAPPTVRTLPTPLRPLFNAPTTTIPDISSADLEVVDADYFAEMEDSDEIWTRSSASPSLSTNDRELSDGFPEGPTPPVSELLKPFPPPMRPPVAPMTYTPPQGGPPRPVSPNPSVISLPSPLPSPRYPMQRGPVAITFSMNEVLAQPIAPIPQGNSPRLEIPPCPPYPATSEANPIEEQPPKLPLRPIYSHMSSHLVDPVELPSESPVSTTSTPPLPDPTQPNFDIDVQKESVQAITGNTVSESSNIPVSTGISIPICDQQDIDHDSSEIGEEIQPEDIQAEGVGSVHSRSEDVAPDLESPSELGRQLQLRLPAGNRTAN